VGLKVWGTYMTHGRTESEKKWSSEEQRWNWPSCLKSPFPCWSYRRKRIIVPFPTFVFLGVEGAFIEEYPIWNKCVIKHHICLSYVSLSIYLSDRVHTYKSHKLSRDQCCKSRAIEFSGVLPKKI
jgi:hypothetical protein